MRFSLRFELVTFLFLMNITAPLTAMSKRTPDTKPSVAKVETTVIPVEGMVCVSCVAKLKQSLRAKEGVQDVQVSLERREARVLHDPKKISPESLAAAIKALGYKPQTPRAATGDAP